MRDWWTPSGLTAAGAVRVGLGAVLLARPALLATSVGVDSATASRVAWTGGMVGIRDAALGAGLMHAVRRGHDPRPWLVAQAASDGVDAVAFGGAAARGHARPTKASLIALVAALGCVAEVLAVRGLSRDQA